MAKIFGPKAKMNQLKLKMNQLKANLKMKMKVFVHASKGFQDLINLKMAKIFGPKANLKMKMNQLMQDQACCPRCPK